MNDSRDQTFLMGQGLFSTVFVSSVTHLGTSYLLSLGGDVSGAFYISSILTKLEFLTYCTKESEITKFGGRTILRRIVQHRHVYLMLKSFSNVGTDHAGMGML